MKIEIINDTIYRIGKNAKENWDLFDNAEGDDILFHLKDDPSPYVIMEIGNNENNEALKHGALLCKKYSKYRDVVNKKIKVIYCEVRYLKKGRIIGEIIIDDQYINEISV